MEGLAVGDPERNPSTATGEWCVRWRPAASAPVRLFCLAHAGGGATAYRLWAHLLAPRVEVVAVRLPGRETRFREPPFTAVDDVVPDLLDAVEPWLDRPYAWFGHSLGALIAFEVCHELRRRGHPGPARLFVSGRPAPDLPRRQPAMHAAPTEELIAQLRRLQGTPQSIAQDAQALSVFLPTLRADLAISETYQWHPRPALDCPLSVFGGDEDPYTTMDELRAWQRQSTAECRVRLFHGGHFFLHQRNEQILAAIAGDINAFARIGVNGSDDARQ